MSGERVVVLIGPAQAQPAKAHRGPDPHVLVIERTDRRPAHAHHVTAVSLAVTAAALAYSNEVLQHRRAVDRGSVGAVIHLVGRCQSTHRQRLGRDVGAGRRLTARAKRTPCHVVTVRAIQTHPKTHKVGCCNVFAIVRTCSWQSDAQTVR